MKTVLLIEDSRHDSRLIQEALQEIAPDLNFQVEQNGVDAVLYLKGEVKYADREKYPLPDLILLDLGLPLFDGLEFLEWLRKERRHRAHIPVVIITGSNRTADVARAYELGADAVLTKSGSWERFKRDIQGLMRFSSKKN